MPVEIVAVLALLPELFPGVQEIPMANLRPNPDNPGAPLTGEQVQEMADNLAVKGLLNEIRVQPDRTNPLAGGAQLHPDNPRLRADGRPWELGDFNFMLLTGEHRYRGALKLQWPTIRGTIHYLTARDTAETIRLDNAVRDRGWWADYQSIEQEIKADPDLSIRQVGLRLKMDKDKVGRALRLLPLLNQESRALCVGVSDTQNKGILGIPEMAAARLASLGPGPAFKSGFKKAEEEAQKLWPYPAIPPETQDLVLRALGVAVGHQMTEAQVKRLVGWVKNGNSPESYSDSGKGVKVGKVEGEGHSHANRAVPSPETATPVGEEALSGTGVASSRTDAYQKPELATSQNDPIHKHRTEVATSPNAPIGAAPRNDSGNSNMGQGSRNDSGNSNMGQGSRNDSKETAEPSAAAEHQKPEIPTPHNAPIGAGARDDGKEKTQTGTNNSHFIIEMLAGIPLFKQIQKKVKSGEQLNKLEVLFLGLHDAAQGLAWAAKDGAKPVLKVLLKYGKKFAHGFFKLVHGAFKGTANLVAPLPHSSHSSGKHGSRSMTGLSPQMLLQVVLHWGVYSLCWLVLGEFVLSRLAPSLKPWIEFPFRYMAYLLFREFPAWAWPQARHYWVAALFAGVLLVIGLFRAFSAAPFRTALLIGLLGAGWFYGRGWGTANLPTIFNEKKAVEPPRAPSSPSKTEPTNSVVEPQRHEDTKKIEGEKPQREQPKQPAAKAPETKPASQTLHAWNPTDESRATWEGEAAALPPNVRIKNFPVPVDPNMGGTMAESRLTDLGNSENVFLMQGRDRHKILSARPDSVNFTLAADAGLMGVLGEKPKVSFYWEELKAIHCDELDVEPGTAKARVFYQCGLLLASSPKPIVLQCATAGDLEHLVSALEFYIRASGHPEVPISGLPYGNQGMLMGDQNQVTALWAQSPADKALINFGEFVWSVGYSDVQPERPDLEAKLQGLPPGNHALYVVTPAEWQKAKADGNSDYFNPQTRKVELAVP